MFKAIKKNLSLFLLALSLLSYSTMSFAAPTTDESIVDDSLRDISVVLGSGVVGAILGLSTLSFVNNPSEHIKNVAVGGAIGIVVGVSVVIFSQATRSTAVIGMVPSEIPLNAEKFSSLTRQEFADSRIASNYLKIPSIGYNFSF